MHSETPNDQPDHLSNFLASRDVPCPNCGYNLRNSASNKCAECGFKLTLVHSELAAPDPYRMIGTLFAFSAAFFATSTLVVLLSPPMFLWPPDSLLIVLYILAVLVFTIFFFRSCYRKARRSHWMQWTIRHRGTTIGATMRLFAWSGIFAFALSIAGLLFIFALFSFTLKRNYDEHGPKRQPPDQLPR